MRFPDPKQVKVVEDWVKLPKLGWVHFRRSRPLAGEVRHVTISREGEAWYISFCVRGEFVLPNAGQAPIGIDLGIAQSVTTSLGEVISFPVPSEKEERRLRLLQRRASRRQKGSRGRRLACRAVAKLRRHWARRRRDAAHKASTRLATTHVLVALEDLPIQRMTASARGSKENPGRHVGAKAKMNRGMLANAHADFRRMLAYKCARSGARLVIVDPAYTSQTCQACRQVSPENRKSQAVFLCTACGFAAHADWNAAVNVLAASCVCQVQQKWI
jgi:putative transposase